MLFHLRDAFRAGDSLGWRGRAHPAVVDADRSLPVPASPHDWLAERQVRTGRKSAQGGHVPAHVQREDPYRRISPPPANNPEYLKWCEAGGIKQPMQKRTLNTRLTEGGFGIGRERTGGAVFLTGCQL